MTHIHIHEKEQFKKLFTQEHIDNIEERFKILEVFLQTENHITFDDFRKLLEQQGYECQEDFVRDTLRLMCRFGFATRIQFEDGPVRYEHRHLGYHHDHMICTKCRKIIEFHDQNIEDLQVQIAARHGFHMLQHKMEIYGICPDCLKERFQIMPLTLAKQGEHLIIESFAGGSKARMRLMSMGLRVGDDIEIITSQGSGQLVVAIDYKRYVLGKGLAQKIMVQHKKGQEFKGK